MQNVERNIQYTVSVPRHFLAKGIECAKAVGRVVTADLSGISGMGTGFLISPKHILTCHHVIPTIQAAYYSRIEFNFFEKEDGLINSPSVVKFYPSGLFATNEELNITIVMLDDTDILEPRPFIPIPTNPDNIIIGEDVNLIHHSGGEPQSFSIRGLKILDILENYIHYSGESARGSAGAPVFNDHWQLLGVHHARVPLLDDDGQVIATDGSIWNSESNSQIQWVAKEAIRISRIAEWLDAVGLSDLDNVVTKKVISTKSNDQKDSSSGLIVELPKRDSVFISYAHADQKYQNWKDRLVLQISPIPSIGETRVWEDSRIEPGANWLEEIEFALQNTRVAIFLVGPHFLNSKFIMTKELPPLIEAAKKEGVKIIPLITDYCPYSHSTLSKYQSFNDPNQPLESLERSEQNRMLLSLASEVANIFSS